MENTISNSVRTFSQAIRLMVRQRRFFLVTVLVLALGIRTRTALFSVMYGVLLKPLPVQQQDRLVVGWKGDPKDNAHVGELSISAVSALAQEPLRQQIRAIASEAHGKVSVACSLPGSTLNCDLNPNARPPMQSVFKLPLAFTVLHQVEKGTFSLDQPVRFLPEDRILPHVYSPLQDQYPDAGVDVPLRELLRLTVSLSDNVAADILLRLAGGPKAVNAYIAGLGISGFHLQDSEAVLHHEVSAQYRNWFEPAGAVQLLRRISDNSPLTSEHTDVFLWWMTSDLRTKRLEGDLPAGTRVAHKSGTSDVDNGVAHATNDIGLIPLPDGRRIAIAVFVTDSTADEAVREQVIARIARAVYDASLQSAGSAPSALMMELFASRAQSYST
jgi:beta-lactamase class A